MTFLTGKVDAAQHREGRSTVSTQEGVSLQGSLVLDATGHRRQLVKFDQKFDPGYQGAYGIIAGGPQVQAGRHIYRARPRFRACRVLERPCSCVWAWLVAARPPWGLGSGVLLRWCDPLALCLELQDSRACNLGVELSG